ncbi:eIF-2-alpha kinase GCN2 [Anopheles ziemanni]|uniref:eIF-2-alpha kinase GCN2 n=1 Tax=Anopheles coustani TaxID=139045 RepID=UPI00265AA8EA|nr:eIF-2-alpha kinase GCN2 [Anopheles coustani]XP_058174702.1 eIF-2-alpha kinase GCN2 [Anopheles ziemanni]
MAQRETFRERQENELEVIKSIFHDEVEDLRPKEGKWKPLELQLHLTPQKGSAKKAYVKANLHIICNPKYPKYPPKVELKNAVGLSDSLVRELTDQLQRQADELKGEVMIYELANTVQTFLHQHNVPPKGSFYDEMLANQQQQALFRQNTLQAEENLKRQAIQDELQRRKKELARTRRESRQSLNDSSPLHRLHSSSSTENSDGVFCLEHRRSELLYFRDGRKVLRGACLGHSQRGCITYSGIDQQSGELIYLTEWTLHYDVESLEIKLIRGRTVDTVVTDIERLVESLTPLRHKHLITYEGVLCRIGKEALTVFVAQEFILGTSLFSISGSLGWSVEGASMVAKGALEALIYLHNNGVSHDNLSDSTMFMDNAGMVRVADFRLIPYIQELGDGQQLHQTVRSPDLPALGSLIEALLAPHSEMKDFIEKCKSERTISATDLLDHPFLRTILLHTEHPGAVGQMTTVGAQKTHALERTHQNGAQQQPPSPYMPLIMNNSLTAAGKSRIQMEFEILSYLGKGAYGDVLKVRNMLDNREYAIKRIRLPARSKQFYKKMTREVELLSRLNHENVVRYYNSWVEAISAAEIVHVDTVDGGGGGGDMATLSSCDWSVGGGASIQGKRRRPANRGQKARAPLIKKGLGDNGGNTDWIFENFMPNDSSSDDDDEDDEDDDDDDSNDLDEEDEEEDESGGGGRKNASNEEESSGGIEFVGSNGEVASYSNFNDGTSAAENGGANGKPTPASAPPEVLYMYIQMEFCEKSTLRTAIDADLYQDVDRVWRLFREIVEGLSHIHQQGMIHRDLKPVNIFLDSRDQVKIGDFGLATTSILALQNQSQPNGPSGQLVQLAIGNQKAVGKSSDMGCSLTGKVGTALYVAPELTGNASRSTYNQKVDLYSLGIILFEMSSPPLSTGMERVKTLMDLRCDPVRLPESLLVDGRYSRLVQVIRWLLNHDPHKRPTAEELLSSELVPRTRLEAEEIQDVVRHILSNPQSRHYKHLIARCFAQESDPICELSYHFDMVPMVPILPRFDYVKEKVIALFRKHGAIEVVTPLLTPYTKHHAPRSNTVKLMTHSGSVVTLPDDLRLPFLRHVALNGIRNIRRYSVGRVYREKKVFNFHPKQVYECAFDIVTPSRGYLITDAELLTIAMDVMKELNLHQNRNVFFRLNHIGLLRAVLIHCNVPVDKYRELFEIVAEFLDEKISKFQLCSLINAQLGGGGASNGGGGGSTKVNVGYLCDALQLELSSVGQLAGSILKTIIRGKGEAASLAKVAVRELETVVTLAQNMGVQCPLNVCPGLPVNYERAKTGGIVWQLLGELKPKRKNPLTTIAVGGRYDGKLLEFQKSGINNGLQVPKVELSGAGFSFLLDKLVNAIAPTAGYEPVQVMICVTGSRPQLKEVAHILRPLWSNGIKTAVVETSAATVDDLGKEAGANVVVLLGDGGELRVRSWDNDRFQERHVTRPDLIAYVMRTFRRPDAAPDEVISQALQNVTLGSASSVSSFSTSFTTSASSSSVKLSSTTGAANVSQSGNGTPPIDLVFLTNEKVNPNKKRRFEHQVEHKLSPVLSKFHRKEKVTLIVVDLPSSPLRGLVGLIDPLECGFQEEDDDATAGSTNERIELQNLCDRYPKYRRQLKEIYSEIVDLFSQDKRTTPIVGVYSVVDTFCRLIL